jgi:tight adherence protein B
MDTWVLAASLLAGAAVVLLSFGVWSLATVERQRVAWRVSRTGIRTPEARVQDVRLQDRSRAMFTPVDRAISKYTWAQKASQQLQKAEVNLTLSEFIALRVLATFVVVAVPLFFAFREDELLIGLAGIGAGVLVWWQIGAFVRRKIQRRQNAIEAHLDEALVNLAGSLRAGFSFPQACQMAVPQLHWPLNEEIQAMLEEVNVGAALDNALRNLAERVQSYEMDITVNAVLVQRQVGGSLAEILDSLARTLRERRELRGHIMALTAQQRLSAYFVAGIPLLTLGLLCITSWQFMAPLFLTFVGNILMAIGVIMDILGFLVMRRLTRIDY